MSSTALLVIDFKGYPTRFGETVLVMEASYHVVKLKDGGSKITIIPTSYKLIPTGKAPPITRNDSIAGYIDWAQ